VPTRTHARTPATRHAVDNTDTLACTHTSTSTQRFFQMSVTGGTSRFTSMRVDLNLQRHAATAAPATTSRSGRPPNNAERHTQSTGTPECATSHAARAQPRTHARRHIHTVRCDRRRGTLAASTGRAAADGYRPQFAVSCLRCEEAGTHTHRRLWKSSFDALSMPVSDFGR
jgi:hypothetical protein